MSNRFEIRQRDGRKVGKLTTTRERAIAQAANLVAGGGSVRVWCLGPLRHVASVSFVAPGQPPRIERFDFDR